MNKLPEEAEVMPGGRMRRVRRWLKRRRIAVAFGISALAGLALGWDWLAASGLLVVALAGLGCLLMCVFGLHGGGDKG